MDLRVIGRDESRMPYGDGVGAAPLPAQYVYLHHSVTVAPDVVPPFDDDDEAIRTIARIGAQRFGAAYGFPYTFGVTPVGRVYAGHHVAKLGAHTRGLNDVARAIVWVGDYRTRPPTRDQVIATAWLLQEGVRRAWWRAAMITGGHRQAPGAATECPGDAAMAAVPEVNRLAAGPTMLGTDQEEADVPALAYQVDLPATASGVVVERVVAVPDTSGVTGVARAYAIVTAAASPVKMRVCHWRLANGELREAAPPKTTVPAHSARSMLAPPEAISLVVDYEAEVAACVLVEAA